MTKKLCSIIFIALALIYGFIIYLNRPVFEVIAKPLPVLVLIISLIKNTQTSYNKYILSGFIFCLIGDILLMRIFNMFLFGLVSFLVAHLLFIAAFWNRSNKSMLIWSLPFFAYGTILFIYLSSDLAKMFFPVLLYTIIIVTMVWRAFLQRNITRSSAYAFYGAILFCISDSLLAFRLFHGDFPISRYLIMASYWAALYLIALTVDKSMNK